MKPRLLVLVASVAFCLGAANGLAHERSSAPERYFANRCGHESVKAVKACIHRAAIHWGADYSDGVYIAWRESRWLNYGRTYCPVNPQPVGDEHATGLFQFLPSTFDSTPYAGQGICDPKVNALAWAWAWAHGWQSHWGM